MTAVPSPRVRVGLAAKLLVSAVAFLIAFGLAEIGARLFYPTPPELGREPQLLYQSDPELGFVNVPGQSGYLDDGFATVNDLGLRGPRPDLPKPADSVRVLAIGDSTTFGWGVGDAETYPQQLAQMLQDAYPALRPNVINAGVVSYDLKQSARLLERLAPVLCPDIVLVGVLWNDLPYQLVSPDGRPQPSRASSPSSLVSERHRSRSTPRVFRMANQPSRLAWLLRRSRLLFAIRHAWLGAIARTEGASNEVQWEMALLEGLQTPTIDEAWHNVSGTLAAIHAMGRAGGFDVGVIIMPVRAQVERDYPAAAYQSRLRQIAGNEGIFVIDPLQRFGAAPRRDALFIPYDRMHFTRFGNRLLAEAAFDVLRGRPQFQRSYHDEGERR